MVEENNCPQCGCQVTADAPSGLCPNCLLGAGLVDEDLRDATCPVTEARPRAGFVPPKPHQLADRFPQFEILDLLGYGGMGAVYMARQKSLDRLVALKIIKPDAADDAGFAERFEREAKALAKLSHTNIVSVHDSGKSDGLYYFVMEYVDGTNLRHLIETKALAPEQAIAIIPQVCEALQFAHDEGIVHRDIKPENILVDSRGRVKIADFGLAKLLGKTSINEPTLTGTHQVMGTPRYMAPEQMTGSKMVDHRADIYSLGVVFYEMLTGELPMGRFDPPSRRASVDARLDEVVMRALAREPGHRYQHASEVRTDVEAIQSRGAAAPARGAYAFPPVAVDAADSRFSRKAILGACWAPLFFVGLLAIAAPWVTIEVTSGQQPPAWTPMRYLLVFVFGFFGLLGVPAPFGTTILGFIAISDIRGSRGTVRGLGLAFCDAIFFPLLVVDLLLGATVFYATWMLLPRPESILQSFAPLLLVILLTNIPLVVWLWGRVSTEGRRDGKSIGANPSRWNGSYLFVGFCFTGSILGLICFALWYAETAWVLAALAIPWLGVCTYKAYYEERAVEVPHHTTANALLLFTFLVTIGLIGLGVAVTHSAWPLFGIAAVLGGGLVGFGIGHAAGKEDLEQADRSDAAGVNAGVKLEGESAADEDQDEDQEESPREKLEWVAWCVGLIGAVRAWALFSGGGKAFEKIIAGEATIWNHELLLELSGPVMVIAAISAYHARFYWLAVAGTVLCLPTGNCLPVIFGIYSFIALFDPKVRALFLANDALLRAAGMGAANGEAAESAGIDPRFAAKPPMPRGYGDQIGSTLGTAWNEWWLERDAWITRAIQSLILLLHIGCLLAFLGFAGRKVTDDKGQSVFTHEIGFPAPWFTVESTSGGSDFAFTHYVHWSSLAWIVAAAGFSLAYIYYRIEKVRNPDVSFWHKPEAFLAVWGILALADIGLGMGMGHLGIALNRSVAGMAPAVASSDPTIERRDVELPDAGSEIASRSAAIHEACARGDASRVKELLDAGASVNEKDAAGQTLLMKAIASGNRSLALTLVVLGADLTEQDEQGRTALMMAVAVKDKIFLSRLRELQKIAYEQDADMRKAELRAFSGVERSLLDSRDFDLRNVEIQELERQVDKDGATAGLLAARDGDLELLVQVATTVDSLKSRDHQGRTIAMEAAFHGHTAWFDRLRDEPYFGVAGTNNVFLGEMLALNLDQLALTDNDGRTALQLAAEQGHTEIADTLRAHLRTIVDNQAAEIAKGGDDVAEHHALRRLALQALGEPETVEEVDHNAP